MRWLRLCVAAGALVKVAKIASLTPGARDSAWRLVVPQRRRRRGVGVPVHSCTLLDMSMPRCPACAGEIPVDDVNVSEGVALCRACGKLHRLSGLVEEVAPDTALLDNPPAGCRAFEDGYGSVVRASCRTVPGAIGTLFACCFWNGILSIFLVDMAGSVYRHAVGPLPHWFPTDCSHSAVRARRSNRFRDNGFCSSRSVAWNRSRKSCSAS